MHGLRGDFLFFFSFKSVKGNLLAVADVDHTSLHSAVQVLEFPSISRLTTRVSTSVGVEKNPQSSAKISTIRYK